MIVDVSVTLGLDVEAADKATAEAAAWEFINQMKEDYDEMCDVRGDNPCPTVEVVQTRVETFEE